MPKSSMIVILAVALSTTGCGRSRIGNFWARTGDQSTGQTADNIKQVAASADSSEESGVKQASVDEDSASVTKRARFNEISQVFKREADDANVLAKLTDIEKKELQVADATTASDTEGTLDKEPIKILMGSGSGEIAAAKYVAPTAPKQSGFSRFASLLKRKDSGKAASAAPSEALVKKSVDSKPGTELSATSRTSNGKKKATIIPASAVRDLKADTNSSFVTTAKHERTSSRAPLSFQDLLDAQTDGSNSPVVEQATFDEYVAGLKKARSSAAESVSPAEEKAKVAVQPSAAASPKSDDPWELFRQSTAAESRITPSTPKSKQ